MVHAIYCRVVSPSRQFPDTIFQFPNHLYPKLFQQPVTATFFALSFRAGVNPMSAIIVLVLASGLIGTARLVLNKNNLPQLAAGYILGFLVLYPVIYFL